MLLFVNSERYTFVTILNISDILEDKNIFNWLSENQLKTAFLNWWVASYPLESTPSYRTLQRAEERENTGLDLTPPQRRAQRRALEFRESKLQQASAKAA